MVVFVKQRRSKFVQRKWSGAQRLEKRGAIGGGGGGASRERRGKQITIKSWTEPPMNERLERRETVRNEEEEQKRRIGQTIEAGG